MYPKPETTVMFSSIRSIAKVVGLFLAAPLISHCQPDMKINKERALPLTILLMTIQWQLIVHTPKMLKLLIFYAYTFVVYAIFQFLFVALIPRYCTKKIDNSVEKEPHQHVPQHYAGIRSEKPKEN